MISRPLASSGVDGQTHFRPGMCAKDDSGFCEWNGPPEKPPPEGSRSTIGTGVPARQRCFAAIVTRWSQAHETKSANCISATGRMPIIAAPVAPPTIAVSESGASSTRHGAELLLEAERHLERAAVDADVLADHEDALVAAHLLRGGRR